MSLESFFGLDDADSQSSAEASEKFREQMRKNSKALKAMGAHQKNQKKREDKLAKILVKFIQDHNRGDIVFLIVKLLQEDVPGAFILAILSISDPELEKEFNEHLLQLKGDKALESEIENIQTMSLIDFQDGVLPENVKADLNAWGDAIYEAGALMPGKTLSTVLTPEQKLKSIVLDLINFSLEEYFDRHGLDFAEDRSKQFALLSIQSVLVRLRDLSLNRTDAEIIENLEPELEELVTKS